MTEKTFMERWKQGIMEITPFQTARITYQNTWLMVIGIGAGIAVSLYKVQELWWLLIILVSAMINTVVVQIGNYQKYEVLRKMEVVNE